MTSSLALENLVQDLASLDESRARRAVAEIMATWPMAALPERWNDDSDWNEPAATTLPDWLVTAGKNWFQGNRLLDLCVEQTLRLDERGQDLFFTRVSALLGLDRLFAARLRELGHREQATRFVLRLDHTRHRQFPPQLCFAPTLRCQLHCSYCISAGTAEQDAGEPDRDRVVVLLDWLERQGIRRLGLSGGEPTLSPLFSFLLREAARRGMTLYMASNGIFSDHVLLDILELPVASVTLHLTAETLTDDKLRSVFLRNGKELVRHGCTVALRCNLTGPEPDPVLYAGYAEEAGIREVRVAVPNPNAQLGNAFVEPDSLGDCAGLLERLHRACMEREITLHLAKPFPLCLLAEKTARAFLGNGSAAINCPMHQNDYGNNIVVHPDFSFLPCLGLSIRRPGPITDFANLRAAGRSYADLIMPLMKIPFFAHCSTCPLWKGSRCVGACLSYRLRGVG
ncbi:MAG: hypothetical protein Kow0089_10190 [Desulfobulbaceae bacterium]